MARGYELDKTSVARVADVVRQVVSLPRGWAPLNLSVGPESREINFRNAAEETCPAYAVLMITGVEETEDGEDFLLLAEKPGDADYTQPQVTCRYFAANLGDDVAAGELGRCTLSWPAWVLYDEDDGTPLAGQQWGPYRDTWKLKKRYTTHTILGRAGDGRVLAAVAPLRPHGGLSYPSTSISPPAVVPFWSTARAFQGVELSLGDHTITIVVPGTYQIQVALTARLATGTDGWTTLNVRRNGTTIDGLTSTGYTPCNLAISGLVTLDADDELDCYIPSGPTSIDFYASGQFNVIAL